MPLQRHPALLPLSRDHHIALQLAAALRAGAFPHLRARLPEGASALAAHVRRLFDEELGPHFETEELYVMAPLDGLDREVDTLCADLRREHAAMRALVRALGEAQGDAAILALLDRLGTLLEAHVRTEERSLFARAQELLDAPSLAALETKLARHLRPLDTGEGDAAASEG